MPPCSVNSAKSPWAHTPGNLSKYAPRYCVPSGSFQKPIGRDGKDFVQTSSPLPRASGKPLSSNTSTAMPRPLHCSSPSWTGSIGLPRAKHDTMSVPPEMEARAMSAGKFRYTSRKFSCVSGEPVERMVRSEDRSWVRRGTTRALPRADRYFALVPKTVMRSASTTSMSAAGLG